MVDYQKDFSGWHDKKRDIEEEGHIPQFSNRDIWWCSVGVNIGHETDGKNRQYSRPILVIRKFNKRLFWGVPLTTQIKNNPHYHRFVMNKREQCAMLTQLRLWDAKRLSDKMGRLAEKEFQMVKSDLIKYLI